VYARIVRFAGTGEDLDRGIAAYREQVLPYVFDATGFRGQTVLVDREGGAAISITLWADEEALRAYEEHGAHFRDLLGETWQTPVTSLDTYEVVLLEPGG
jgi:heme-degrading monooxygenase HmoA